MFTQKPSPRRRRAARARPPETAPAVGGARSAQKASTRARILEAARAQLEEKGYEATGLRDVGRAAGVAAGTVVLHFRDKSELMHAALFDDLAATWARARAAAPSGDLVADLGAVADAFFAYYAARPALARALLRESLFAAPPWSARFAGQVAEVHQHVVTLADAAAARGELDPALDRALLGTAFLSFYYFALLAWLQGGHEAPGRLVRGMLAQHLGRSASPKQGTRRRKRA